LFHLETLKQTGPLGQQSFRWLACFGASVSTTIRISEGTPLKSMGRKSPRLLCMRARMLLASLFHQFRESPITMESMTVLYFFIIFGVAVTTAEAMPGFCFRHYPNL
jgi:hypothetical protein